MANVFTQSAAGRVLACAVFFACVTQAVGGEDAGEPLLKGLPAADGQISWWLVAPQQKIAMADAVPPAGAREGEPVAGTDGKWALLISPAFPMRYVDLKPFVTGKNGIIWATARIHSENGGKRKLRTSSYCALRIFLNGKQVLDKPQPWAPRADDASADIELPKGASELQIAVAPRSHSAIFYTLLCDSTAPGAVPRAAYGDELALPVARGAEPGASVTESVALQSLTFVSAAMFVKPGQQLAVGAGIAGSVPTGLGPLTARLLAPDGTQIGETFEERTAAELSAKGWRSRIALPDELEMAQDYKLEILAAGKVVGTKATTFYSFEKLVAKAAELEEQIGKRALAAGHPFSNAALAAEKASLCLRKIQEGEEKETIEGARQLLELLNTAPALAEIEEKKGDPFAGKSGYFERAYTSAIDGGAQPYFMQTPTAWENSPAKYPLVIFLHGYVPSYDKHRWWDELPEFNAVVERSNAFLAIPFGRSNSDFQGSGEEDVLAVIREMKRLYPIDADRVYLYGYSMGGMAVYTIAAHHPDLFAAGVVLAGRADSPLQNHKPMEQFHLFKQWLMHADNPISLCENLVNVPLRIYHGREDFIIPVKEAERMEKRLLEMGCDAKLEVVTGDHQFGLDVMGTDQAMQWLLKQKRVADPEKRRIKSYSSKYARQGNIQTVRKPLPPQPIDIEWTRKEGFLRGGKDAQLLDASAPAPVIRNPPFCGPVREATCGPFVIVFGTTGSAEANARNINNAERFAREWYEFGKSRAQIKADSAVSQTEKETKNLFLFGEEQENSLHAEAADYLPIKVKNGKVTIAGKINNLIGKGIIYAYPNKNGNALVICAGIPYGERVGVNHKLDLLPDFLLYDQRIDTDSTSTNRPICAGYFDAEWKIDPQFTWWFNE